ncbi:MAG: 50S ribosomal protein L19 [Lentisphaerota bacterium]
MKILDKIDQEQKNQAGTTAFRVGDAVRVFVKIKEGDKERVQLYAGTVIARDGHGSTETFTVRRISYGEGVERVFPIHAPSIDKLEVERSGRIRKAKLYYLRGLTGKKSKISEKREDETPAAAAIT